MLIILHRQFVKQYKKLFENEKNKFKERRNIFLKNPFHSLLNNHLLHGKFKNYRSINITADIRIIYDSIDNETAHFIYICAHSELYS